MRNLPDFATNQRAKRQDQRHRSGDIGETGAALWITAAVIILIIAGLSLFADDGLKNGGAPFVITPSSQTTTDPPAGL